jgi:hypothetical protein
MHKDICLWDTPRLWFDLKNIFHHIFVCETVILYICL